MLEMPDMSEILKLFAMLICLCPSLTWSLIARLRDEAYMWTRNYVKQTLSLGEFDVLARPKSWASVQSMAKYDSLVSRSRRCCVASSLKDEAGADALGHNQPLSQTSFDAWTF